MLRIRCTIVVQHVVQHIEVSEVWAWRLLRTVTVCNQSAVYKTRYYCPSASDGLCCVRFLCTQDNSRTAALSSMNFAWTCTLTTARNLLHFKVIGQRSRSQDRIMGFFHHCEIRQTVVSTITHEPLHWGWWYFVRTCISTTSKLYWISRS